MFRPTAFFTNVKVCTTSYGPVKNQSLCWQQVCRCEGMSGSISSEECGTFDGM